MNIYIDSVLWFTFLSCSRLQALYLHKVWKINALFTLPFFWTLSQGTTFSLATSSVASHTNKAMLSQEIYFRCQIHVRQYTTFETLQRVISFTQKNENPKPNIFPYMIKIHVRWVNLLRKRVCTLTYITQAIYKLTVTFTQRRNRYSLFIQYMQ